MDCPQTYTDVNETGCCAVPDVEAWDRQIVHFSDKPFIRKHTRSLFHVPLNMEHVMTEIQEQAELAGATMPPRDVMILSRDLSAFRAEHLYAVTGPVDGADNVALTGDFATRVFEGPYSEAPRWLDDVGAYAGELGRTPTDVYFFYTTCPRCAKHYGKNYVIALARLDGSTTG
jgi:hypothetical protein